MNWKQLEVKILDVVRRSFKQYSEKWVTAETLSEYVETLKVDWLKKNGSCFNRTRVCWTDEDGVKHSSSWLYPLHEIQEMIQDGRIKNLQVK